MEPEYVLINDKQVARIFQMSTPWVRVERHKRRKGLPHFLTVDARYIGTSPRYVKSEIDAFVGEIVA
jgi:predicted DNA-binding transcriptional regulator AlpA